MSTSKYEIYKFITQGFRDNRVTHEERIKLLKAAGITGEENIEFDNRFREVEDSDIKLSSFDPDIADETDLKDFFDTRGNK